MLWIVRYIIIYIMSNQKILDIILKSILLPIVFIKSLNNNTMELEEYITKPLYIMLLLFCLPVTFILFIIKTQNYLLDEFVEFLLI